MRRSGVLLPISSLPSPYGIGTFSKTAYEFIDFLNKAGLSYWQILPLGPTGYGDSPYQSFSTFAGNPYFIDLDQLVKEGFLTKAECEEASAEEQKNNVNYELVYKTRFDVLRKAFVKSKIEDSTEFQKYCQKNAYWLADYALYMAVKNSFDGISWVKWDEDIKTRTPEAMAKYQKEYQEEILFYEFQQYLFAKQWSALKQYAHDHDVEIIGDIPIYVAFDSADTWANPELFQFDKNCNPIAVAGCPPDAFSATGQLWGNPLYRWEYHKKTNYKWWVTRIAYCFELYDVVRIDHFRGFDEYYAIPSKDETAEFGKWEVGPGYELFETIFQELGDKRVIAEDLGFLTPSVLELVQKTGYPGMKILQFAFDSREESDYLPHNYTKNCVVYTGTHDNDTTLGWFETFNKKDREFAKRYLDIDDDDDIVWKFIRAAFASVSDTAIIPMQDFLELGSEARMNTPSTLGMNWGWRMNKNDMTDSLAKKIYDLTKLYARIYS